MVTEHDIEEVKSRLRVLESVTADTQSLLYEMSLKLLQVSLRMELLADYMIDFLGVGNDIAEQENSGEDSDQAGSDEEFTGTGLASVYSLRNCKN